MGCCDVCDVKGLRTMKHVLLCVSVALGVSLSAAIPGYAFSIGEIKVQSHLHTPFVAEVPLIMKPHERDQGFVALIGDEGDYQAEGVARLPVIATLRPSIILGPSDVIRIISTEPIEVAAFDLLLLVRTGKVTIVQNYPVTLTPDPRSAPMVAKTTPPADVVPSAPNLPAQAPPAESRTSRVVSPARADWLDNLPARYGPILRGEMLYKVMVRLGVPKSHIWQAAVRLWEHNQARFVRGNLHGLQVGSYLDIPPALRHALTTLSRREAQQRVAAQWDLWQKPVQIVVASAPARAAGMGQATAPEPVESVAEPPESVAFAPDAKTDTAVNMATLETMLQGFERRLTQRLSLPSATVQAADEHAITFVSADDLQTAIQGLETRLIRQLETGQRPAGAWTSTDASESQPPLQVGMETALASFLFADSLVYVFIVQNVILLAIAAGVAWRWYRKRSDA